MAADNAAWYAAGSIFNNTCPFSTLLPSLKWRSINSPSTRARKSASLKASVRAINSRYPPIGCALIEYTDTAGAGGFTLTSSLLQAVSVRDKSPNIASLLVVIWQVLDCLKKRLSIKKFLVRLML